MPDTLPDVLARFMAGELSLEQANECLLVAPLAPGLTCVTCAYLHGASCQQPGQPTQPMHPQSVRCHKYNQRDERAEALPVTPQRNGSMMFK
jgi:hypothetical protein